MGLDQPEPDRSSPGVHLGAAASAGRFGRYVVQEKLGEGGMAEVHRAIMTGPLGFQKAVALKRILPGYGEISDFRERFIEEARVSADLTHSNIVQIFEFGEIGGRYFLAMELVDGMDVEELIGRARRAGLGALLRQAGPYLVAQAARGLAYAHAATRAGEPLGLVHRDISPQNLLVSRAGEVKVTDFGIVRVNLANRLTAAGSIMGKLRYMSPEQALEQPLDQRTDLFALGLVLHELLTGQALLGGESPAAVLDQLKAGRIPPPSHGCPEVPPELDRIVCRALAFRPGDRQGGAAELARELECHDWQVGAGRGREALCTLVDRMAGASPMRTRRREELSAEAASFWASAAREAGPRPPGRAEALTAPMEAPEPRNGVLPAERAARARTACRAADRAVADGSVELAERLYQGALVHAPGYGAALRGLGEVYARTERPHEARALFERYLRAAPGAADAPVVRARLAGLAGLDQPPAPPPRGPRRSPL